MLLKSAGIFSANATSGNVNSSHCDVEQGSEKKKNWQVSESKIC